MDAFPAITHYKTHGFSGFVRKIFAIFRDLPKLSEFGRFERKIFLKTSPLGDDVSVAVLGGTAEDKDYLDEDPESQGDVEEECQADCENAHNRNHYLQDKLQNAFRGMSRVEVVDSQPAEEEGEQERRGPALAGYLVRKERSLGIADLGDLGDEARRLFRRRGLDLGQLHAALAAVLCAVLVFGTTLLTKHTILPRTRNPVRLRFCRSS